MLEVRRGQDVCAWLEGRRREKEKEDLEKTFLLFKLKGRGQSRIRLPFYDRESFTEVPDETIGNLLIEVKHNGPFQVYLHIHDVIC